MHLFISLLMVGELASQQLLKLCWKGPTAMHLPLQHVHSWMLYHLDISDHIFLLSLLQKVSQTVQIHTEWRQRLTRPKLGPTARTKQRSTWTRYSLRKWIALSTWESLIPKSQLHLGSNNDSYNGQNGEVYTVQQHQ